MRHENWSRQVGGNRIHIFGPSGSGTSTLGRELAGALASQHFDSDDFFWYPSDPPFQAKRPVADRHALMEQLFLPRRDWVLSGSLDNWSGPVPDRLTLAIRLMIDPALRRSRLESRESLRCTCGRGWGQPTCPRCTAFLIWADGYEAGDRPGRSLAGDIAWSQSLPCPVMVLDSAQPVRLLVRQVLDSLDQIAALA